MSNGLNKLTKFPCTSCGCCCKRLGSYIHDIAIKHHDIKLMFPYKWDENGVCEKLVDNKCQVYENRPVVCNVDKMRKYEKMSRKAWYAKNAKICNNFMDKDNIPLNLRIH